MLAVVKDPAKRGIVLEDVPVPTVGTVGGARPRARGGDLRQRSAHLQRGEPGPPAPVHHRPRDRRRGRRGRRADDRRAPGNPRRRRDLHRLRHLPPLQGRARESLREAGGARRHRRRRDDGIRGRARAEHPPAAPRPGVRDRRARGPAGVRDPRSRDDHGHLGVLGGGAGPRTDGTLGHPGDQANPARARGRDRDPRRSARPGARHGGGRGRQHPRARRGVRRAGS